MFVIPINDTIWCSTLMTLRATTVHKNLIFITFY